MTDVKLALSVVVDGVEAKFDSAILVTGDSDQVPTIQVLKQLKPDKRAIVAFPPTPDHKFSFELKKAAAYHFEIREEVLAKSQLPDIIERTDKPSLHRPMEWKK